MKSNKNPIIIGVIIAVVIVAVAVICYFVFKSRTANNEMTPEEEIALVSEEQVPTTIEELMTASAAGTALDCQYTIAMDDGEIYTVNQQVEPGGGRTKTVMTSTGGLSSNSLSIKGDAIYSWGVTAGEEYATKITWDKVEQIQGSEMADQLDTQSAIEESKETITGLVCVAPTMAMDFSIPALNWVDYSSFL